MFYVNGNENGRYIRDRNSCTISELTESFIKGTVTLDDALNIIQNNKVVYASDATMKERKTIFRARALLN